jgi:hypothetical protein
MGSEPQGRSPTVHIPEVLSMVELKVSMCGQTNLPIDITGHHIQNPLKEDQQVHLSILI